nr:MAG TPA: hypothetical protein [Bacteriophage sp.]
MEIKTSTPGKHRTFFRGFGDLFLTNRQTYIAVVVKPLH